MEREEVTKAEADWGQQRHGRTCHQPKVSYRPPVSQPIRDPRSSLSGTRENAARTHLAIKSEPRRAHQAFNSPAICRQRGTARQARRSVSRYEGRQLPARFTASDCARANCRTSLRQQEREHDFKLPQRRLGIFENRQTREARFVQREDGEGRWERHRVDHGPGYVVAPRRGWTYFISINSTHRQRGEDERSHNNSSASVEAKEAALRSVRNRCRCGTPSHRRTKPCHLDHCAHVPHASLKPNEKASTGRN